MLRRIARRRHRRDSGQGGDRRLAHRDHVGARTQNLLKADQVVDELIQPEHAVRQRRIAGVLPICNVDIVFGHHNLQRAAQQRREMARHRGNQQHFRLRRGDVLAEPEQRRERRFVGDFLGHGNPLALEHDAVQPIGRAPMGEFGFGDHAEGRAELTQSDGSMPPQVP
jgi:hypothetical protein